MEDTAQTPVAPGGIDGAKTVATASPETAAHDAPAAAVSIGAAPHDAAAAAEPPVSTAALVATEAEAFLARFAGMTSNVRAHVPHAMNGDVRACGAAISGLLDVIEALLGTAKPAV